MCLVCFSILNNLLVFSVRFLYTSASLTKDDEDEADRLEEKAREEKKAKEEKAKKAMEDKKAKEETGEKKEASSPKKGTTIHHQGGGGESPQSPRERTTPPASVKGRTHL